jgi:hypothetical protein
MLHVIILALLLSFAAPADTDGTCGFPRIQDRVAISAGLEPLADNRHPQGSREIRLWIGGSHFIPHRLVWLTDAQGEIDGEYIRYWPGDERTHDSMLSWNAGRCESFSLKQGKGTCRVLFAEQPDWPSILTQLETNRVWILPAGAILRDPDPDYLDLSTGPGFTVEVRDGEEYRCYSYDGVEFHLDHPDARAAKTIFQKVLDIDKLTVPPREE